MKRVLILSLALMLTLASGTALAMPIQFTEGTMAITATSLNDDTEAELELEGFQLVAMNDDGDYVIYTDHEFYNVDADILQPLLVAGGSPEVNKLRGLETLAHSARNDETMHMQEALAKLGYLEGTPDGAFGRGTERSLKAFQAAEGMEETGEADELLQLLIQSMAAEPIEVAPIVDPEVMYAPIAGRTNVDLQPIMESGLIFSYDDMKGEGFISDGSEIFFDASGDSDIDKYQLTVRIGLLTREDELGKVELLPAAKVSCLCVRRPVLGKLTVKAGTSRGTSAIESLETSLSGVDTLESGLVLLDDGMVDALASASESGELKLRLEGQYNTFDFAASEEQLDTLSQIGKLALQIRE